MQHLIEATRLALREGNWYAAITVALTMPDICGKLEFPAEKSQVRFVTWYNKYLLGKYQGHVGPTRRLVTFLEANDCYALRCAYLHQGEFDVLDQRARQVLQRFHVTAPRPGWVVHKNTANGNALQIQVDIFCQDVCDGVESWLRDVESNAEVQRRLDLMGAIS